MKKVDFMSSNKKGSALLIVIGFLSFMIVSAVAFAIYMRAERLPSSALRRTVATRHLAKAALAEAISRIDDAVRGAPFPGLNDQETQNYRPRNGIENYWEGGRVFMPPNPQYGGGNQQHVAPASETVSVLTIEGLGYVPPPLVNDARFLGRSTWTAQWQNLPFDAGRFAFVALNVSDFFDINRLYANKPRTSNVDGRISLAYLLDPNYKPMNNQTAGQSMTVDGFSNGSVKQFDQFVHTSREGGNDGNAVGKDAPFVSVLDYQLAFKSGISSVMPSLFYDWIEKRGSDRTYYVEGDQNHAYAGRQPFVTESCATNEAWDVDIAYYQAPNGKRQKGQPFDTEVKQDDATLMQVGMSRVTASKFFTAILNQKGGGAVKFADGARGTLMMATSLYDYLDHNDVPLSLAWPCVERVPMIAAIEPAFKFTIPSIQASTTQQTTIWNFDPNQWLQPGMVSAVWTFPFKRNAMDRNDAFKAQAILRVFLAPEGLNLRAAEGLGQLLRPQNAAEWTQKGTLFKVGNQNNVFCLTFQLGEQAINIPSNIRHDNEAGNVINFPVNIGALGSTGIVPLVTKESRKDPTTGTTTDEYTVNVSPLGLDGKPMFQVGQKLSQADFNAVASQNLRPYAAVWMRIVNGDNKTVDLVPAVIQDDQLLNNGNSTVPPISEYLLQESDGPILRFTGDQSFSYGAMVAGGGTGSQVNWSPASFSTVDPRFNWAPEDWYATEAGMTTFEKWLDKTNTYLESGNAQNMGCDPDIFCSVSNQGFLQSLGEFAFIPRLTDFYNGGIPLMAMRQAANGYDGRQRTSPQDIANRQCAWCTYDMNWEVYEAFEAAGIGRSTAEECLVNPYTPSRDIFMAALANTPSDYWAAGTALDPETSELKQQLGDDSLPEIDGAEQALSKYAFSTKNQEARLSGRELLEIASRMQSVLTNINNITQGRAEVGSKKTADAWKWIWDEKLWDAEIHDPNDFNQLFGVQLDDPLYSVDRKFLRSYWRDCFADQQQLFLIFVRAESSAIGGPGEGTPAQKGARAVALVWRNPSASSGGSRDGVQDDRQTNYMLDRRPHQTRILFYHQFD